MLSWPLRRKFEIKLLNQISDSEHHSRMIMFNDKEAARVLDESTMRDSGIANFISLEALKCVTEKRQFHKSDCVFFLVQSYAS